MLRHSKFKKEKHYSKGKGEKLSRFMKMDI